MVRDCGEDVALLAEKYGGLYLDEKEKDALRLVVGTLEQAAARGDYHAVLNCVEMVKEVLGL